jgi:hypothetical protein
MHHSSGAPKGLNFLEVVGAVVIVGVAVVIVCAPMFVQAGIGGAFVGAGTRLLKTALFGGDCSPPGGGA